MRCGQVEERLTDYLDGVLEGRELELVQAHLDSCVACYRALQDMKTASAALRSLPPVRPPASFAPCVRSAIRAAAPVALAPPLLGSTARSVLSATFTLALLAVLTSHFLHQGRPYVRPSAGVVAHLGQVSHQALEGAVTSIAHPVSRGTRQNAQTTSSPAPKKYLRTRSVRNLRVVMQVRPIRATPGANPTNAAPVPVPAAAQGTMWQEPQPDVEATPDMAQDTAQDATQLVALPAADRPSTSGPTAEATPSLLLVSVPTQLEARGKPSRPATGEDALLSFEELFNESSLPRYLDVS